jgi:hypothetical protein
MSRPVLLRRPVSGYESFPLFAAIFRIPMALTGIAVRANEKAAHACRL